MCLRTHWAALLAVSLTLASLHHAAAQEKSPRSNRFSPERAAYLKARESVVKLTVVKKGARESTIGTGVIIDPRGYVVTNYHVVRKATAVRTFLHDNTKLETSVELLLPDDDLAVLKVKAKEPLKALRLGPAGDVLIAEKVIAIGHPFGYQNTVTDGIVSSVGRELTMPWGAELTNLIQTSAAINPGSSGGALMNMDGELIGITVALRKEAQNIAFAINADDVQRALSKHLSAWKLSDVSHRP